MGVHCDIHFSNSTHGTFHSGQLLTGHVQLKLTEPKKFNEICLQIVGSSTVKWSTKRGRGRRRRTVYYAAKRDHLSSTKILVEAVQSGSPTELPAGEHKYEFSCELPRYLPTSFEGSYGHCRYIAQVVLNRPWQFNLTYKVGFTVIQPLDLNTQSPAIRVPALMEDARVFCCGLWRTKPLIVRVTVPFTGFVPGQAIPLTIDLNNQSSRVIEGVNMKLIQEVTYNAEQPTKRSRKEAQTVVKHIGQGVDPESKRQYEQRLVVPTVAPTCAGHNLINVSYRLHLTVRVEGCGMDPVLEIPLVIGTIPLTLQQPQPVASAPPLAELSSAENAAFYGGPVDGQLPTSSTNTRGSTAPPEYIPPPSYEEAMNAATVEMNEESDANAFVTRPYVPLYPVYNFNNVQMPPLPPTTPALPLPPKSNVPEKQPMN